MKRLWIKQSISNAQSPNWKMEQLKIINETLAHKKAEAAQLNADMTNPHFDKEQRREKKQAYMRVSAEIANLKLERQVFISQNPAPAAPAKKQCVRIANLLFPGGRVQYFASELTVVELMTTLSDVFKDEMPAVVSCYSVLEEEEIRKIPAEWYELVSNDEEPEAHSAEA